MIIDNKKILIGAGVVVVGYLLYKNMKKNQSNLAECTKEVEKEIANTAFKLSADFDMDAYKKKAIDKCLQNKKNQSNSTSNVSTDINAIPDSFVIKSDGYNTTYSKRRIPSTFGVVYNYSKISGRTDGSIGMGSPTIITSKEFEDAYKEFLKQPKTINL